MERIRYNTLSPQASERPAEQNRMGMTRRTFLTATAANVAVAGIAQKAWNERPSEREDTSIEDVLTEVVTNEQEVVEAIEIPVTSEVFDRQKEMYTALYTLDREQILFVDAAGTIVGDPVPFADFVIQRGTKINDAGVEEPFFYKLTPAAKMDNGAYAIEGIPSEWSAYVQELHAMQHGVSSESLSYLHATADFRAAMHKDNEPALQAAILSGEIRTIADIVHYFAAKPAPGYESESTLDYINANIEFTGNLATKPIVVAELKRLLPGVCALESKYDNSVTSPAGARTIFQFKPRT